MNIQDMVHLPTYSKVIYYISIIARHKETNSISYSKELSQKLHFTRLMYYVLRGLRMFSTWFAHCVLYIQKIL